MPRSASGPASSASRAVLSCSVLCLLVLPRALAATVTTATPFDDGKAGFALRVRDEVIPYRTFGVFVSPGEKVPIKLQEGRPGDELVAESSAGSLERPARDRFTWTAPSEPGHAHLEVSWPAADRRILLHFLVLTPLAEMQDGRLDGYRIGKYPATPLRGLGIYRPPPGLFRVTPELVDLPVSPHFTLGQFLCKQEGDFPKYLILRERLLLKLEYLLQRVNERGIRADTFFVMSGYRTPHYNHAIGNVKYSRHQWGGAADIFVDVSPRDGVMDDVDGDGRVTDADADFLYDLVAGQVDLPDYGPLIGGLGRYGANHVRGPFVHVDARGFLARWGR